MNSNDKGLNAVPWIKRVSSVCPPRRLLYSFSSTMIGRLTSGALHEIKEMIRASIERKLDGTLETRDEVSRLFDFALVRGTSFQILTSRGRIA